VMWNDVRGYVCVCGRVCLFVFLFLSLAAGSRHSLSRERESVEPKGIKRT
jgi:hypothetical protein